MTVLRLVPKIVWVGLAAALVGLMFVPNIVRAEDSCGFIGIILGCDQQQKAAEAQGQLQVQQQQLANEAEKAAYAAKVQFEQLANENAEAAATAQNEQQRLAFESQAEQARISAQQKTDELNALVSERMNQVNASATVNLAALQSETVKHLADTQVVVESNRTDAMLYLIVIVALGVGGWGWYTWNKRKTVEAQLATFKLLSPENQQRAARLEEGGMPFNITKAGQITVQHPQTGQWFPVVRD